MSNLIRCRAALVELNLTEDGLADLLKVSRASVVSMVLDDAYLPQKHTDKVAILLNMHRTYYSVAHKPIGDLVVDMLKEIHRHNGKMLVDDVKRLVGLSGPQMKNVERVEGWVAIVWEVPTGKQRERAIIYLTAAGYAKLGIGMPADFAGPPRHSRAVVIKGLDDVQSSLLAALNRQIEWHLRIVDSMRSIQTALTLGLTSVDDALTMYDLAVVQAPTPTLAISNDKETI